MNALTQRKAVVSNDTLVLPYMLKEVRNTRTSLCWRATPKHSESREEVVNAVNVFACRPPQRETQWQSPCTVLCSTGSCCTSTTRFSTAGTWRSRCLWVLNFDPGRPTVHLCESPLQLLTMRFSIECFIIVFIDGIAGGKLVKSGVYHYLNVTSQSIIVSFWSKSVG